MTSVFIVTSCNPLSISIFSCLFQMWLWIQRFHVLETYNVHSAVETRLSFGRITWAAIPA